MNYDLRSKIKSYLELTEEQVDLTMKSFPRYKLQMALSVTQKHHEEEEPRTLPYKDSYKDSSDNDTIENRRTYFKKILLNY